MIKENKLNAKTINQSFKDKATTLKASCINGLYIKNTCNAKTKIMLTINMLFENSFFNLKEPSELQANAKISSKKTMPVSNKVLA